jgi:NitT/TauT family transport system ATP-binding protein
MLRAAEKHHLKLDVIETALSLDFPPEVARTQIETLINWGRYAELLTYDDDAETISLEPEPVWVRAISNN